MSLSTVQALGHWNSGWGLNAPIGAVRVDGSRIGLLWRYGHGRREFADDFDLRFCRFGCSLRGWESFEILPDLFLLIRWVSGGRTAPDFISKRKGKPQCQSENAVRERGGRCL
jgi:hypothetical protein